MDYLKNLNKEQKEAVLHKDGPCLVVAGAGTGKTSVLTTRIAHLINSGVDSSKILAITFTNKAAKEMKERVDKMVVDNKAFIGTFHSFGLSILKEKFIEIGRKKNFTIIDNDDTVSIVKKILKDEFGYNLKKEKDIKPVQIKDYFSTFKNKVMSEEEIEEMLSENYDINLELAIRIYPNYLKYCQKHNFVDFEDLLLMPVQLFKEKPGILTEYQAKYDYILIDEYQDTNDVQFKMVQMLAKNNENLFVVGDPSQSIYSFRGANFRNILNFEKDYPNAKKITLEQNYRSVNKILRGANSVIKHNKERLDVSLYSNKEMGANIKSISFRDEKDEARFVGQQIAGLLTQRYKPDDIVLLYRTNAQSRIYEEVLRQLRIPAKVVGNSYFQRREILDILGYVKLVANTDNDIALKRIINTPRRGIGNKSVEKLEEEARKNKKSLFDSINEGKALEFKELINDLVQSANSLRLIEVVKKIVEKSGLVQMLEESGDIEERARVQSLYDFIDLAGSFEEEHPDATLLDFLNELGLTEDVQEKSKKKDTVTLMTIHKAKGLEFPVVFIVGAEEGFLPGNNKCESDIEEERRLMYVAITRAKEKLLITNAGERFVNGERKYRASSRFLDEIKENDIDRYKK